MSQALNRSREEVEVCLQACTVSTRLRIPREKSTSRRMLPVQRQSLTNASLLPEPQEKQRDMFLKRIIGINVERQLEFQQQSLELPCWSVLPILLMHSASWTGYRKDFPRGNHLHQPKTPCFIMNSEIWKHFKPDPSMLSGSRWWIENNL